MRQLPAGTVTFLFTDIEGSTRLLHELGDRYAEVLAEHRRVLREAFAAHGGVEVDTQGDAFFVAFARATDGVAAAAEAQEALAEGPVRVRMGLHTGEPTRTDEGYVGMDVHRAARIASAAHGGQVLLSERTARLFDGGSVLTDLGMHRLKDLGAPEKLYQLGDELFPTLRTLNATNLPAQPGPLVGRERELGELVWLVRERRLITLSGPGGSGKTRLALQVAAELVDDFKDGVFWIPLAALSDPELVETTVAHTIGAKQSLAEHLDEKHILLLLDNLEQLLPVAPVLAELLTRCPHVHLLVTSRAPLRVVAESEYVVEPLPESDAVTLFVERAAQSAPEGVVGQICRRLDGLPLAIELAAARTRVLSAQELLERLERTLPLLTSGPRDAPARQRTLRATIEWSCDLLAPPGQEEFARLGIFAGSFTIDAAETICDANLDQLELLAEHSLVRRWESGRLGMLETIREFALELLEASGEADKLHRLHADHFLALAEAAQPHLRESDAAEWLERLDPEHANLRAAIEWAIRTRNDELKLRFALALRDFWFLRSHLDEGARRFDEVLGVSGGTSEQRLLVLGYAAMFACERGLFRRASLLLEERLAFAREVGDELRVIDSLRILGTTRLELGDPGQARKLLEESVALARSMQDAPPVTALAVGDLGLVLLNEGRYEAAIDVYQEALSLFRGHGDTRGASLCLENIAVAELRCGRPVQASLRAGDALRLAHQIGNPQCIVNALAVLAAAEASRQHARRAAIILGAQDALRETAGYSLQRLERQLCEEAATATREELGDAEYEAVFAHGHGLPPEDVVAIALGAARG